jgi:O-antigen ligase
MALRMHVEKIKTGISEFIFLIFVFIVILFFSSTYFMSYWWAHAVTCILACANLRLISKYTLTWILIANTVIFSNQTRFSLEFLLIALGLSAWAFRDQYLNTSKNQKLLTFLSLILISVAFTLIDKSLNERYAFLSWLPVLITLYFPIKDKLFEKNNLISSILSTILVLFSSKKSVILGFFAQYLSVIRSAKSFLLLGIITTIFFFSSFIFQDNIKDFYNKSISPRLIIWQSAAKGFLNKPIGGNGFGIFPMEINANRKSVHKIGGKLNEHLNHAHNNFLHIAFEQGVIGLSLFALLLWFLYKNHTGCFWTFLVISMLDASLVYSTQYFLAALIFIPAILNGKPLIDKKFFLLPPRYQNFSYRILLLICLISFGFSVIGHYYYEHKQYGLAIKFDSDHSLYQFFAGIKEFKKNKITEAIPFFEKSISLSKNYGFQQGFLATCYYMAGEQAKAIKWISESIRLDGDEAQWKYIAYHIYKDSDPKYAMQLKEEAIARNPLLVYYDKGIMPPKLSTIGGLENSSSWINSFQRRAETVYLPTPQY